jgi:alanyl-tRNA synthetase
MTGNIGFFKIVGESSVASGIRRIEALTGAAAVEYIQKDSNILHDSAMLLKENPEMVSERIKKILSVQKSLEKEVEQLKAKIAMRSADWAEEDIKSVNDIKVLAKKVAVGTPAELRDLADRYKEKIKTGIVVLGSSADSKALLIVVVTKDLTDQFHAGKIVKEIASVVGGGGGGRPDMAQAGGTMPENLDQALEKVYEVVGSSL